MSVTGVYGAPRLAVPYVERTRLREAIDRGSVRPLTILHGPSGSGKTLAVSDWCMHRTNTSLAVWLTADDTMAQPTVFWNRLLLALEDAKIAPEGSILARLIDSLDGREVFRQNLRRGLLQLEIDVVVVIDEFQRIGNNEIRDDLLWVLANSSNLHVVLTTTASELESNLTQLVALSPTVISRGDLAMTGDEVAQAIKLLGHESSSIDAEKLRDATAGMPLLVRIALDANKRRSSPLGDASSALERVRQSINIYLDEEFFAANSPTGLSTMLMRTSVTEYFDLELARELVDGDEVPQQLARLEARGIGTWHDLDGSEVFRLVPIVREVLLAREQRTDTPEEIARLHAIVARWALKHDHEYLAIEHAGVSQDAEVLVDVITTYYINFMRHYGPRLHELFERLPKDQLRKHPELLLLAALAYNAVPSTRLRALDLIRRTIVRQRNQILENRTDERADWINGALIVVYRIAGMHHASANLAREVIDRFHAANLAAVPSTAGTGLALLHAAITLLMVGDCARAIEAAELVGEVRAPAKARLSSASAAYSLIAYVNALKGEMNAARHWLDKADALPSREGWKESYNGAFYHLASAIIALNDNEGDRLPDILAPLEPHRATIELWPFILHVEGLAGLVSNQAYGALTAHDHTLAERQALPEITKWLRSLLNNVRAQLLLAVHNSRAAAESASQAIASNGMTKLSHAAINLANGALLTAIPLCDELAWDSSATSAVRMNALTMKSIAAIALRDESLAAASIDRAFQLARLSGYRLAFYLMPTEGLRTAIRIWQDRHPGQQPYVFPESLPVFAGFEEHSMRRLTPRESAVLTALLNTANRDEIARQLYVSPNTVKSQLRSLYKKLGVSTREDAILVASEHGLLGDELTGA